MRPNTRWQRPAASGPVAGKRKEVKGRHKEKYRRTANAKRTEPERKGQVVRSRSRKQKIHKGTRRTKGGKVRQKWGQAGERKLTCEGVIHSF